MGGYYACKESRKQIFDPEETHCSWMFCCDSVGYLDQGSAL